MKLLQRFSLFLGSSLSIPSTGAGLQQSLIGLLIVLAVIVGLAWLTRQLRGRAPGSSQQIKLVAQLAVGSKERISLVELADTWILVGITQTQLNALHVMPKAASTPDQNTTPNQPFAALFDTIRSRNPHA
jgi:flagellar protein FliO/FliZ